MLLTSAARIGRDVGGECPLAGSAGCRPTDLGEGATEPLPAFATNPSPQVGVGVSDHDGLWGDAVVGDHPRAAKPQPVDVPCLNRVPVVNPHEADADSPVLEPPCTILAPPSRGGAPLGGSGQDGLADPAGDMPLPRY